MQLGRHLRELWGLRRAVAIGLLLATLVALWSAFDVRLFPPGLVSRGFQMGTANTRVLVDAPKSLVLDLSVETGDIDAITNRALLVGNVMASAPVREHIARRAGIPVEQLKVSSPITREWPRPLEQSGEAKNALDIFDSPSEYRLSIKVNPTVPVIDIFAGGPSAFAAAALANSAVTGTRDYMRGLASQQSIAPEQQVTLQQLGRVRGAVITRDTNLTVAVLAFALVFATSCAAILFLSRIRRGWTLEAAAEAWHTPRHSGGTAP